MATVSDNLTLSYVDELRQMDAHIDALQTAKREFIKAKRDEHGKHYADGLKNAIKLSRMDSEKRAELDATDAETARILDLIERGASRSARRATHAIASDVPVEEIDPDTGEIIETLPVGGDTDHADSGLVEAEPREVATLSPETANEAAGTRPVPSVSGSTAPGPVERLDASNSATPLGVTVGRTESGTAATIHEATDKPASPQGLAAPGTVAAAIKLLRPLCQHPDVCASHGTSLCFGCRREAQFSGAAA